MKKIISAILAAVLLLLTFSSSATAAGILQKDTFDSLSFQAEETEGTANIKKIIYHTGYGSPESYEETAVGDVTLRVDYEPDSYPSTREGYVFVGWAETDGGAVKYSGGEIIESSFLELYAVWCPIWLESDEVFPFRNSKWYFTSDENDTYYLSDKDFNMLEKNILKVFGLSPVPGIALSAVLATYPNWKWKGSCYGISTVTALQHYGLIDVKPLQNAESLVEMTNDESLISIINYYQATAATSWLCENKATVPGSRGYAASMKDMFESVKDGKIVLYTFYSGNAFVTAGHTVLLTGAYEDTQGNHIFVTYDCNHAYNYTSGEKSDRFKLSPDYKHMTDNNGNTVGDANWTDTYTQFEPFKTDGSGKITPWYYAYFTQIKVAFKRLFTMFSM